MLRNNSWLSPPLSLTYPRSDGRPIALRGCLCTRPEAPIIISSEPATAVLPPDIAMKTGSTNDNRSMRCQCSRNVMNAAENGPLIPS